MDQLHLVYFSPSGNTKKIASLIADSIDLSVKTYDLILEPPQETILFDQDNPALFAVPVFGGRVPVPCEELLKKFKGDSTPAIAVVVYGNRAYDDALLELKNTLQEAGFQVFAAAAFIAQHSLFPEVAKGRPDEQDQVKISEFGHTCIEILQNPETMHEVTVKGDFPYCALAESSFHPKTNSACTGCGTCAKICPTGAISAQNPRKTDSKRCIACTACVSACPAHARSFHSPMYSTMAKSFAKKVRARQEPEFFF